MKDFFRLLTVAVLSFALVGAALLYSGDSDMLSDVLDLVSPDATTTHDTATAEAAVSQGATRLWVERPRRDVWMGIAGFPDQYALRFPVPSGIAYTGGTLELGLESQLAADGDGRLTISVNGVRRGEVVLGTGLETHDVEIELGADELSGRTLDIVLAGTGTTNSGQVCPTNAENSGSAVTLLPSSGLALYTDDPVDAPNIRLAMLPEPIRLSLGETTDAQAASIWAAQILSRAGVETRFSSGELADIVLAAEGGSALGIDTQGRVALAGRPGIDAMLSARAALAPSPAPHGWPVTASELGAETLVRNFRGSRRWTLSYRLADLEGGRMPTALDLRLMASTLADGNDWVVRVSLNGNLLHTQRFDGASETLSMDVPLPTAIQGLRNDITIELIDTSPNDSICRTGPDAQAQLLPATALSADGRQPANGWGAMVRALAGVERIGLIVENELSQAEALQARAMLSTFLPVGVPVDFGTAATNAPVQMTILDGAQLQASIRLASRLAIDTAQGNGGALITPAQDAGSDLRLTPVGDPASHSVAAALSPSSAAILISSNRP